MKVTRYSFQLVALIVSLLLAACGGGSGGGSASLPPPAPTNVTATAKDGYVLLDATVASDAAGVNVYWSTSSGVSKANGTKIVVGSSPQAHTGLANSTTYYYVVTAVNANGESAESAQVSATPVALASLATDPLNSEQWHLQNTGQSGANSTGTAGEDLNVQPVWTGVTVPGTAIRGNGIRIAVVDDGLEIGHEDLATNVASNELSYNYATGSNDPSNPANDTAEGNGHGTAVAGIIAARGFNGIGTTGVAPFANVVGYNYLKNTSLSNAVDAMTRGIAAVHVSNNSWGPNPKGNLVPADSVTRDAINTGLATGRGGKGTIYVFAAGNGGPTSNANYKGTSNTHGTIVVGAVNDKGQKASYSEEGASLLVSAPSGEYCDTHTITTTDRTGNTGFNLNATATDYINKNYTRCMNGTSAATPGVSGVAALMLEARPELGWRDVRLILAETARQNDAADSGWFQAGASNQYHFNHKYGFGVANAAAAVALAKTWTLITGAEATLSPASVAPNTPIPDATGGNGNPVVPGTSITSTINVPSGGAVSNIEYVEITFNAANHTYMGDLEVLLTSPAGKTSRLAESHPCQDANNATAACVTVYDGWVFGSSAHLGENTAGSWTLTVTDKGPGDTGNLQSWGLKFYGR